MIGYWNLPEETAKAFTEDGWFKSGDAGYLDEDGYLYIHDRVKDMIVSGGENVYPAEVENVLMAHPAIADVAVIGVPHEKWGETAKAIVVGRARQRGDRGRDHRLRQGAAGHVQVPDDGRVDRRAAAQPERQGPQEGPPRALLGGPRAPRRLTPTARQIPVCVGISVDRSTEIPTQTSVWAVRPSDVRGSGRQVVEGDAVDGGAVEVRRHPVADRGRLVAAAAGSTERVAGDEPVDLAVGDVVLELRERR